MMKTIILTLITFFLFTIALMSQSGSISGKVTDIETGEAISFATINLEKGTKALQGTYSDTKGLYQFDKIDPGIYSLKVTFVGYKPYTDDSVSITSNQTAIIDIRLKASVMQLVEYEVVAYSAPLIRKDQTTTGASVRVSSDEIFNVSTASSNYNGYEDVGLLTASELNDFSKWQLWSDIRDKDLKAFQKMWGMVAEERYLVQVTTEKGNPVIDASVKLRAVSGESVWQTRTDNTGKAELWNNFFHKSYTEKLEISVIYNELEYLCKNPHPYSQGINALSLPVSCDLPANVEIAFVVDATGSMDDEIMFLQSDLIDIMDKIKQSFPELEISLGSVFYRCIGNSYTTKTTPLTPKIEKTTEFIGQQSAGEGGAEAVEEALASAVDSLGWSDSARSRILFFILDEQPLLLDSIKAKIYNYTAKAAEIGIRIVPVVASAETMAHAPSLEYIMRSIALATNGTYVFLTDHSNIGEKHAIPVTDRFEVELLNSLLKRLIFQYCYVPGCEAGQEIVGKTDTVFVSSKKIITTEILDSLRTKDEKNPKTYTEIFHLNLEASPADPVETVDTAATVNQPVVEENGKEISMKIYPNPTTGKFIVSVEGKIEELYLFDLSGKLMAKFKPGTDGETEVDITNYSTGIYFLKFLAGGNWYTGKVILER